MGEEHGTYPSGIKTDDDPFNTTFKEPHPVAETAFTRKVRVKGPEWKFIDPRVAAKFNQRVGI